ncbi:MAG: acetylneuraminic acid synthetase [Alteromonadaceae bacterium]|nr:acetylneuraminic acid synthetase [Alteromonadaceae bacterium]
MQKIKRVFSQSCSWKRTVVNPYVIAEIGVNHEGDMELAKRLIREAKEGGADAAKFQTYKASTLASKDSPAYWDTSKEKTTSQYLLFKKHEGFWQEEMVALQQYCKEVDIEFMSTPFDIESANFLNEIMDVFKISSSDLTNKPFIEHISRFGKPIILSTGASDLFEIQEAVSWIRKYDTPLALLHCVLNYPTAEENANLGMISALQEKFPEYLIGYSDHVPPGDMKVCETAAILGSVIIEKHFTHDKSLPGNDHYHAMDKYDLMKFRSAMERSLEILGSFTVEALLSEAPARLNARRSLVLANNIKQGQQINESDLTFKRPATGISPKYIEDVVGKIALRDISEDEVLKWNMLDD